MKTKQPNNTALRTALWWALHVFVDDRPHIICDKIGYELIKPEQGWQNRPDMKFTKRLRASIVGCARYVEDLAKEKIVKGIRQYVLLGAGLDSFALRNIETCSQVDIYEIDEPATLTWKEEKLIQNGYKIPSNLHFVPVDFETSSWWNDLIMKGFDIRQKTFLSCTGVTLYLTKDAIIDTLKKMTSLALGSTFVITFYLPLEQLDEEDKPLMEMSIKGAAASGAPFRSFFSVGEVSKFAKEVGLKTFQTISTKDMTERFLKIELTIFYQQVESFSWLRKYKTTANKVLPKA
jgi:methyltransferase (TIGR00027 family)